MFRSTEWSTSATDSGDGRVLKSTKFTAICDVAQWSRWRGRCSIHIIGHASVDASVVWRTRARILAIPVAGRVL